MLVRRRKKDIAKWIADGKKALLVTGARQVGKTYLIRECLKESGKPYVEFNFIEQPDLVSLFMGAADTGSLLNRLSLVADKDLVKGETIVFFDEVQEYKDIVTRIKFLVEEGSFRYILSGSLLGVELNDLRSAPVGYLGETDLFPMDFEEFIRSLRIKDEIISHLESCYSSLCPVDEFIHKKILELFHMYLIVGGMPEAVDTYIQSNDLRLVAQIHEKIIRLYRMDFAKYELDDKLKIREIYDAMAGQLTEKNKRFRFNKLGKNVDYDRTANSFLWLKAAGVALPVYNVSEPKRPLIISENRNLFKLFFSDVGLLTSQYSTQTKMDILNQSASINNGALFENAVAQELVAHEVKPYYFNSKKQGELDFVTEIDGEVLPIEVKSGKSYKRHSALENVFRVAEYGIRKAVILCSGNVEQAGKRVYLPIYMVMFLKDREIENPVVRLDLSGLTD